MSDYSLPADLAAEAAVIGAALIDPAVASELIWLTPDLFTHPVYALAWRAVGDVAREAAPDLVTVLDRMATLDASLAHDGITLVYDAVNVTPHASHARHYAGVVLRLAQKRLLITAAGQIASEAYQADDPDRVGTVAMQRLARILALSPAHHTSRQTYSQVLDALADDTWRRMDQPESGLRTGFARIDSRSGGYEPGQLILLAGRPGSGKSALLLAIARRVAGRLHAQGSGCVDVATLEMPSVSQARRLVAGRAGLDTQRLRGGFRCGDEVDMAAWGTFSHALESDRDEVGDALAFHEGIVTTDQLSLLATEAKNAHGLRLLAIDQLDLMGDAAKDGNETARIGAISLRLKQMAMRLGIVVLCAVQLNRQTEARGTEAKRPQLADLRQSGRLEQDADMVYGLYRPSYYLAPREGDPLAYAAWAELLTLKHRDGEAGVMIPLRFDKQAATFDEWDGERWPVRDMARLVRERERSER